MSNNQCKATTKSRERCKLKAGSSGYCHIHDPDKLAALQAEQEAVLRSAQERHERLRSPRFSQRKGLKPGADVIQVGGMNDNLRNSIWNVLNHFFLNRYESTYLFHLDKPDEFTHSLWADLLKRPIHRIPRHPPSVLQKIFSYFTSCEWYEVYDFVEFVLHYADRKRFQDAMNEILARELSGYRFVSGVITEITDEQEVEMLEHALAGDDFPFVRAHLQRALELMSDRQNPDYRNSIKESISAVESFVQAITGDPHATLGKGLAKVENSGKQIKIHPALKSAFSNLYGYTSDEGGIRHAMLDEPDLSVDDARFFLMVCTSFANYLKSRL